MATGILGKRVNMLPPSDVNGAANTEPIYMGKHTTLEAIVMMGTPTGTPTLTVEECTTEAAASNDAIAFEYQACTVAYSTSSTSDVFGELTAATSSGIALSGTDYIFYRIIVHASRLTDGHSYVRLCFSNPSTSTYAAVLGILHDSRYGKELEATIRA